MPLFKELQTVSTAAIRHIEQPADSPEPSLHTLATAVLTDFSKQNPLMLEQNTSIDAAIEIMNKTHVSMKLVIDGQETFRGLITLGDLLSTKVIKRMELGRLRRHELTVAQVMIPRSELQAIEDRVFATATIGDVLATMKKYGVQHLLVVDSSRGSIRGLVSASDIARRMHVPIVISERANTFSDICKVVAC